MRMTVFFGSDYALPLIPFNSEAPAFWVGVPEPEAEPIRQRLNKPFFYEAGSHEGCGCGFNYDDDAAMLDAEPDVPESVKLNWREAHEASVASVKQLAQSIRLGLHSGSVAIYGCWYGEWKAEPESVRHVEPEHFGGSEFRFVERELLIVETVAKAGREENDMRRQELAGENGGVLTASAEHLHRRGFLSASSERGRYGATFALSNRKFMLWEIPPAISVRLFLLF